MLWIKIFLSSALAWRSVAGTGPSYRYGAPAFVVSRPYYSVGAVRGARSAFISRHGDAELNHVQLRARGLGRSIPPLKGNCPKLAIQFAAAPMMSKNNEETTTTSTKTIRRRKSWEESYDDLKRYRDTNGHCNVPQSEKPLGPWVNSQRIEHARYLVCEERLQGGRGNNNKETLPSTSMTAERKKLLGDLGFVWDIPGHTWNTRYDELCEFRKINGHCVVPRSSRLGAWVEKQRNEYKKYRAIQDDNHEKDEMMPKTILTDDRVGKLNNITFVWDVREKQFEQKLGQLRIFKEINDSIDPRFMNGQLALWVRKYEQQYRKYLDAASTRGIDVETLSGILPEDRRIALEAVGFCRSMFDEPRARSLTNRRATWEERYEELREYQAEHGHVLVPKNYGPLGSWVRAQRHLMRENEREGSSFETSELLSAERVDSLNRLGFVWDVHQWQWNQTYHELLQYKEEHNNTNVPMSYGGLGLWVFNQRAHYSSYRKGKQSGITTARLEMLRNIGFEFDLGEKIRSAADERWQTRLNEVKEYEEEWGTFNIKQSHNPSLYNWCQHQKKCWRNSNLKEERREALQSIGFLDGRSVASIVECKK
ncbi:hypothetical protein ACHAXR_013267 [Thalassiosira sp. AJA248-18]